MAELEQDRQDLARFACDYCRHKMIRCSRTLPKCEACKPWPSSCNYSRQLPRTAAPESVGAKHKGQSASKPLPVRLDHDTRAITSRLARVEENLASLGVAVDKLVNLCKSREVSGEKSTGPSNTSISEMQSTCHSFSSVDEASIHLERFQSTPIPQTDKQEAVNSLKTLKDALNSSQLDNGSSMTLELKPHHYFIPDRRLGYHMMSRFMGLCELGSLFFEAPSPSFLQKIIFEPSTALGSWVVFVNFFLLSSPFESTPSFPIDMLRSNVRLGLDSSSMFMSSTVPSVQALMLLAVHGEEYASPNVSWMLASHASRQAQALSLHSRPPDVSDETYQRRLSLFWSVFVIEKACALAFGRPAFLPTSMYQGVPSPSFEHLKGQRPHPSDTISRHWSTMRSSFGAHALLHGIKHAILTGGILDLLQSENSFIQRNKLKIELDHWQQDVNKALVGAIEAERAVLKDVQVCEMLQGVAAMKSRYLHTLLVLVKGDPRYAELRVSTARQALEILPEMASGWHQVYNGVLWQRLYYPFEAFFALWGHIVSKPQDVAAIDDLRRLRSCVSYFASMTSQLNLLDEMSSKLEHIASVFHRLARLHVREAATKSAEHERPNEGWSQVDGFADLTVGGDIEPELRGYPDGESDFIHQADLDRFLSWLPETYPSIPPFDAKTGSGEVALDTIKEQEARNLKRSFETAFDWFSWDRYYRDGQDWAPA